MLHATLHSPHAPMAFSQAWLAIQCCVTPLLPTELVGERFRNIVKSWGQSFSGS